MRKEDVIEPAAWRRARIAAGMSLQDAVDALGGAVSRQALHKYETGAMRPSAAVREALLRVYRTDAAALMSLPTLPEGTLRFRVNEDMPDKEARAIAERAGNRYAVLYAYEHTIGPLPEVLIVPGAYTAASEADAAAVAERVRGDHGASTPLLVVPFLERLGVRVIPVVEDDRYAGTSAWFGDDPVIVFNRNHHATRRRFTMLHELGHLLLRVPDAADHERLCHSFAAAMLLPADEAVRFFGPRRRSVSREELVLAENAYGISVQAIINRLAFFEIISARYRTTLRQGLIRDDLRYAELGSFRADLVTRYDVLTARVDEFSRGTGIRIEGE